MEAVGDDILNKLETAPDLDTCVLAHIEAINQVPGLKEALTRARLWKAIQRGDALVLELLPHYKQSRATAAMEYGILQHRAVDGYSLTVLVTRAKRFWQWGLPSSRQLTAMEVIRGL